MNEHILCITCNIRKKNFKNENIYFIYIHVYVLYTYAYVSHTNTFESG